MRRGLDLSGHSIIPGNICYSRCLYEARASLESTIVLTRCSIEFSCLETVALAHYPVQSLSLLLCLQLILLF